MLDTQIITQSCPKWRGKTQKQELQSKHNMTETTWVSIDTEWHKVLIDPVGNRNTSQEDGI